MIFSARKLFYAGFFLQKVGFDASPPAGITMENYLRDDRVLNTCIGTKPKRNREGRELRTVMESQPRAIPLLRCNDALVMQRLMCCSVTTMSF
jgi:hypothetical protein